MYIDKSVDIVNKCNNAYHRTIKMKLVNGSLRKYIDFNIKSNSEDSNFEIGDHVGISKHKKIFARGYAPNRSGKVLVISMLKILCWVHV